MHMLSIVYSKNYASAIESAHNNIIFMNNIERIPMPFMTVQMNKSRGSNLEKLMMFLEQDWS